VNSRDKALIEWVARCWVDGGGDAEGFEICWLDVRDAITEVIAEQETEELAESEGRGE